MNIAATQQAAPDKPAAQLHLSKLFNGNRAYDDLKTQVAFGPRVPSTPAARECRKWIAGQLKPSADAYEEQPFTGHAHEGGVLKMYNLIARFKPKALRRIIICAHWDSRPSADMMPAGQRNQPIPGADDGASGVAVLIELSRVFKQRAPPVGVDLVCLDGEDYGPSEDQMYLGARFMADKFSDAEASAYNYGILLDMIGDRNLDIHAENHSHAAAPMVFDAAEEISRELGYNIFRRSDPYTIDDDHTFFIERGIKMYDFIDFTYEPWHTIEDTPDKCSADSLEAVGRTLENLVYLQPNLYAPPKP